MYVTDFSTERADKANALNEASLHKPKTPHPSSYKGFSVGDREVSQSAFNEYLDTHISKTIAIRYQSTRAGSAKYWRTLSLIEFDDTYFSAFDSYAGINKVFRRDRVIEYK